MRDIALNALVAAFTLIPAFANLDARLAVEALDRQEAFYSIRGIN